MSNHGYTPPQSSRRMCADVPLQDHYLPAPGCWVVSLIGAGFAGASRLDRVGGGRLHRVAHCTAAGGVKISTTGAAWHGMAWQGGAGR